MRPCCELKRVLPCLMLMCFINTTSLQSCISNCATQLCESSLLGTILLQSSDFNFREPTGNLEWGPKVPFSGYSRFLVPAALSLSLAHDHSFSIAHHPDYTRQLSKQWSPLERGHEDNPTVMLMRQPRLRSGVRRRRRKKQQRHQRRLRPRPHLLQMRREANFSRRNWRNTILHVARIRNSAMHS